LLLYIWGEKLFLFLINLKKKGGGGGGLYPAIVVAGLSDHLSQSTCLELLHPKTDEHVNPSVEVHHLVEKLFTAESLLTEVQRNKCL